MKPSILSMAVFVAAIAICVVAIFYQWRECADRGGTLVHALIGYECVK